MTSPGFDQFISCPLFSALSVADLERLQRMTVLRSIPAGGYVTRAGEDWPYLLLVLEGSLNVQKESSEGRSLVVAELGIGEVFWGLAFFHEGMHNPMTVQAHQPSRLALWPRDAILPFLLANGLVIWELSRLMVKRMLAASEVIDGLAFQPVAGRLARLLIDFPGQGTSGPIARSLTLDEMAARIGSTREMTCRILQKFADEGLIKITRTEFEITDRPQLSTLAQKDKS